MEKSIEQDLFSCMQETFSLKEVDIREYSPLTLAYIGDSIYAVSYTHLRRGSDLPEAEKGSPLRQSVQSRVCVL